MAAKHAAEMIELALGVGKAREPKHAWHVSYELELALKSAAYDITIAVGLLEQGRSDEALAFLVGVVDGQYGRLHDGLRLVLASGEAEGGSRGSGR